MTKAATLVQLSPAEARLIRTGLLQISIEFANWEMNGVTHHTHPKAQFREWGFDRGAFDSENMTSVRSALSMLARANKRSNVLEMNAIELAACILGARVTQTAVRHGHIEPWRRDHMAATDKLLRKLETLRKRAKRRYMAVHGRPAFADVSRRWQRFVQWVRVHLLYCTCNRPAVPSLGRIRRLRVAEQVRDYKQRLRKKLPLHGYVVPPPAELEKLIKQARRRAWRWMRRRRKRGLPIEADDVWLRVWHHVTDHCEQDITPYERLMKAMGR